MIGIIGLWVWYKRASWDIHLENITMDIWKRIDSFVCHFNEIERISTTWKNDKLRNNGQKLWALTFDTKAIRERNHMNKKKVKYVVQIINIDSAIRNRTFSIDEMY